MAHECSTIHSRPSGQKHGRKQPPEEQVHIETESRRVSPDPSWQDDGVVATDIERTLSPGRPREIQLPRWRFARGALICRPDVIREAVAQPQAALRIRAVRGI